MGNLTGEELMKQVSNSVSSSPKSSGQKFGESLKESVLAPDAQEQVNNMGQNYANQFRDIGSFFQGMFSGASQQKEQPQDEGRKLPESNDSQKEAMGNAHYETSKLVAEAMRNRILDPKAVEMMPLDQAAMAYTQAIGTMQENMMNPVNQNSSAGGKVAIGKPEKFSQYGQNPDSSNMNLGVRQGQEVFDAARKRGGVGEPLPEEDPNADINANIEQTRKIKEGLREKTSTTGGSFKDKFADLGSALFTAFTNVELPGRAEKMAEARGMGGVGPEIAATYGKGQLPLTTKEKMEIGTGRFTAQADALKNQLSAIDASRVNLTTQLNNIMAHPFINQAIGGQQAGKIRDNISKLNDQYTKIQNSLSSLSFAKGTSKSSNAKSKALALAKKYGKSSSEIIAMARKQQSEKNKGV